MDVVARLGGDEFAILQVAADAITANELAARVTEAIRLPFDIDGHRCVIGASVGIMIDSDGQTSAEEILRNADLALYEAKAQGRSSACLFDPEMLLHRPSPSTSRRATRDSIEQPQLETQLSD